MTRIGNPDPFHGIYDTEPEITLKAAFHDTDSTEPKITLTALRKIRHYCSIQTHTVQAADHIISSGVLPRLVEFLTRVNEPSFQYEAEWTLLNIAAGTSEQTRCVVKVGTTPLLIRLPQSPNVDVQEQAAWALGNITGDCHQNKSFVLILGIIEPLLNFVQPGTEPQIRLSFLRIISWFMLDLCRHYNAPQPVSEIKTLLPSLCNLIQHSDKDILRDTVKALSFLTEGESELILLVINSNVVPTLIFLLSHSDSHIQKGAFQTVRNIMKAIPVQKTHILSCTVKDYRDKWSKKLTKPTYTTED